MLGAYLLSLILGGGLLVVSLFGSVFDLAGHVDMQTDSDTGTDHEGFKILSLRNATYFLFGFGAVGALLTLLGDGSAVGRLVAALASGALLGGLSAAVFHYLKKSETGAGSGESSFIGLPGTVTIPLSATRVGKINVQRGDRMYELLARPYDEQQSADTWRTVVVVEMQSGTALVAPVDDRMLPETGA